MKFTTLMLACACLLISSAGCQRDRHIHEAPIDGDASASGLSNNEATAGQDDAVLQGALDRILGPGNQSLAVSDQELLALTHALHNGEPGVRTSAQKALSRLLFSGGSGVRERFIEDDIFPEMIVALRGEDAAARNSVARLFRTLSLYMNSTIRERFMRKDVLKALTGALHDEDVAVRNSAAVALSYLEDKRLINGDVLRAVAAALSDEDVEVRHYAADLLCKLAKRHDDEIAERLVRADVLPAMADALSDENYRVSDEIAMALVYLTGGNDARTQKQLIEDNIIQKIAAAVSGESSTIGDRVALALSQLILYGEDEGIVRKPSLRALAAVLSQASPRALDSMLTRVKRQVKNAGYRTPKQPHEKSLADLSALLAARGVSL